MPTKSATYQHLSIFVFTMVLAGVALPTFNPSLGLPSDWEEEPIELCDPGDENPEQEDDRTEKDPDHKIKEFQKNTLFIPQSEDIKTPIFKYHHSVFHPEIHTPPPEAATS